MQRCARTKQASEAKGQGQIFDKEEAKRKKKKTVAEYRGRHVVPAFNVFEKRVSVEEPKQGVDRTWSSCCPSQVGEGHCLVLEASN
jgi:hypothetical protein